MPNRNLALELLITAKDTASSVVAKVFGFLDRTTSATANLVREKLANIFGGGTQSAQDFEAALARVKAKADATDEEMAQLKKAAQAAAVDLKLGADGASKAAQALEFLTGAGLSVKQSISALPTVLRIATNEEISAKEAAEALTDVMSVMGIAFDQSGRAADILQKAADTTKTSVSALAEAVRTGGGAAVKAGYSYEQTITILMAFAKAGIQGSEAGTALSNVLNDISNPASKARQEMAKFGESTGDVRTFIGKLIELGPRGINVVRAFSEEAGPGLSALLKVGVQGLDDYSKAVEQNVSGSLKKASDTIGNTTTGALNKLAAAWDQTKRLLAEPLLKPMAEGAEALSTKLDELQQSGILQSIGDGIAKLFTDAGQVALDFIKRVNWNDLKTEANGAIDNIRNALNDTISSVQGRIQTVSDWTTTIFSPLNQAIDGYRLAWALANKDQAEAARLQAQIEDRTGAIGRALSGTSAEYQKTAGSAKELAQQTQQATKATADLGANAEKVKQLTTAIADQQAVVDRLYESNQRGKTSDEELAAALQKLWDLRGQAKRAQEEQRISQEQLNGSTKQAVELAQLHAVELAKIEPATKGASKASEQYKKDLDGINQQIKASANNAGDWREGLKLNAVQMYGLKENAAAFAQKLALVEAAQRQGLATDRDVSTVKQAANAAQDRYNKALDEYVTQQERAITAAQRAGDLTQQQFDLDVQRKQNALELAEIKGDENEITRAQNDLIDTQISKTQAAIASKGQEIEAYKANIEAVRQKLAADGELSAADQAQLATMQDTLTGLQLEQAALVEDANAQQDRAEAIRESSKRAAEGMDLFTDSVRRNKEMTERQAEATKEAAANAQRAGGLISGFYNSAIDSLTSLSAKAVNAFKTMRGEIVPTGDELDQLQAITDKVGAAVARVPLSAGGFALFLNKITANANAVRQAFIDQARSAEQLAENLSKAGEGGAGAMQALIREAEFSKEQFNLLDDTRLSNLQSAIDSANDKLREMQDEADAAQARLLELDARLARARGDDAAADRIDQQKQQAEELADIEKQLADARAEQNQTKIRQLEQELALLKQVQDAEQAKLEKEIKSRKDNSSTSTAPSSPSGGSGGGGAPSGGGGTTQHITNNFYTDPTQLASEEWYRQKVLPIQDKINRFRK